MPLTDPSRTLAIFLGAHTFPKSPNLLQGRFFFTSAADVMEYMIDPKGLRLSRENLLWLFDDNRSAPDQLVEIADFLTKRRLELESASPEPIDLFIYYVGHGSFTRGGDQAFCLALRGTNAINEGATSMRVGELATVVKDNATFMKRYLIFDCCFAGSAARDFQSGALTAAKVQLMKEFPGRGTALMCASNANEPARSPEGQPRTMFSSALIHALRTGHGAFGPDLSFYELGDIATDYLRSAFPKDFVRPEVHSPDQSQGDIAKLPLFPNPAYAPPGRVPKRVAERAAERTVPATPAVPEAAPQRPQPAVERPAAPPAQPVRPRPKPEPVDQKRQEKEAEEKRRASQDAAAERVLDQIRRDRAKREERIKLAKQKAAEEEREREVAKPEPPPQPQISAVPTFGMPTKQPASPAAAGSGPVSLVWLVVIVIPLANVAGYLMGWLLAYQASEAPPFLRNAWVMGILWAFLGLLVGFFSVAALEGLFERKVKHAAWFMVPGYFWGWIVHGGFSGPDAATGALAASVLLFLVGAVSSIGDAVKSSE